MRERTETGFEIWPPMKDVMFTVSEPVDKKRGPSGKMYYMFHLKGLVNGRPKKYSEPMMVWMAADILKALGYTPDKDGVFDWDRSEVVGRQIIADVTNVPDRDDPHKLRHRLSNLRRADGAEAWEFPPSTAMDSAVEEDQAVKEMF